MNQTKSTTLYFTTNHHLLFVCLFVFWEILQDSRIQTTQKYGNHIKCIIHARYCDTNQIKDKNKTNHNTNYIRDKKKRSTAETYTALHMGYDIVDELQRIVHIKKQKVQVGLLKMVQFRWQFV